MFTAIGSVKLLVNIRLRSHGGTKFAYSAVLRGYEFPYESLRRAAWVVRSNIVGPKLKVGIQGEVIVADNGSTDGSQSIAAELGARVVPIETRGYGSALRGGIAAARGRFVIIGDSDDSYDFTALGAFLSKLKEGADLVMGNRFLGNPGLSRLGRLFFKCPVDNSQCSLRGFRKDAIDKLNLQTSGMEFSTEMVAKATLFNLRIAKIPTVLSPDQARPPAAPARLGDFGTRNETIAEDSAYWAPFRIAIGSN